MREYDDIPRNGEDLFEELLRADLSALPPDEELVRSVTPWRRAMSRILWGFGLTSITLNFWCLNYIFPAVGAALLLLGFRTLRQENGWLRSCWVMSLYRAFWQITGLTVNATIWADRLNALPVMQALGAVNLGITVLHGFFLWRGLRAVRAKAGFPPGAGAALGMTAWYLVICLLALVNYSGLVIAGAVVVAYLLILRSLYRLTAELDEAGYAVSPAPVRLSDRGLTALLAGVTAAGMLAGFLFFQSYPMAWERADGAGLGQDQAIREHLLSLGYPEEALNDLTPEDLALCEGALKVMVKTDDFPVNDGREVREVTQEGPTYNSIHVYTVYDVKELRLTHVGVLLPGERQTWQIFHHFCFTENPGFHGTEGLHFWPADRLEGWGDRSTPTGRVLYDKDGQTWAAPYYRLGSRDVTTTSWFAGTSTDNVIVAEYSLPNDGERQRGYVSYSVKEMVPGYIIDSWVNYIHRDSWLQYPVRTALGSMLNGGSPLGGKAVKLVQDALQFSTHDVEPELIE